MVFIKIFDHNNLVYFLLLFIVWCSQYETLCVVSAIYGPSSSALCGGVIVYFMTGPELVWDRKNQLNVTIIAEEKNLTIADISQREDSLKIK